MFSTGYREILALIDQIDPIAYGKTRNYIDGAVTKLSPYISRGIISTKMVAQAVLQKGYHPQQIESFLKELAWRDYFQQVWMAKGDEIDEDLKQSQPNVDNHQMLAAITDHQTGIIAIDEAIKALYNNGYMHNHVRMYTASICCNLAKSHWKLPAKWLYYHLLDADWASNALSWQWVAGSFSSKKYFANQENINRYCHTQQKNTFLDVPYEAFEDLKTPDQLLSLTMPTLSTSLPKAAPLQIVDHLPTCIYNFYNLDVIWMSDIAANRVLLLEPSFFNRYPVSEKTVDFILKLAENIKAIQIFVGEFAELKQLVHQQPIHYKEHPTCRHYQGIEHQRDWMFDEVKGYFPSFFSYWKQCAKHLKGL
jgi:deoxyribodipyrimidine photo-lyase